MLGESHLGVLDPLDLLDELALVSLDRLELLQQRLVEDLDGDLARVARVEAPPQLAEGGGRRLLLLLDLHRPLELGGLDAPVVVLVHASKRTRMRFMSPFRMRWYASGSSFT